MGEHKEGARGDRGQVSGQAAGGAAWAVSEGGGARACGWVPGHMG